VKRYYIEVEVAAPKKITDVEQQDNSKTTSFLLAALAEDSTATSLADMLK
jgi:hypothetical protein